MALSPKPRCSYCLASSSSTKLFRCQACTVVSYCGRDDQIAHRPAHKDACNRIKKAQQVLSREEQKLRSNPGDGFITPPRLFEEHAGHFWGILETRTYMRSRFALVEALLKIKTYAAVKAAHEHVMDMLRLCRSDNMGVRFMVPALYLRLGKDQECYDFCVWYATTGEDSHYDWGDLDLPFLDVRNADVFEPLRKHMAGKYIQLNHVVGITLLKIRLLLLVQALRNASMLAEKVSQELLDAIRVQLVSGTALAGRLSIKNVSEQTTMIRRLQGQIKKLYRAVDASNEFFWPALLSPGKHLTARPDVYSPGSPQEMQISLQYNYASWAETTGSIDVIRQLINI